MKRTKVTVRPVADRYSAHNERRIEFMDPRGRGGLITFTSREGELVVNLYRLDPLVRVVVEST